MLTYRKSNFRPLLLLIIISFLASQIHAQEIINLTNKALSKPLGKDIEFFVDSTSSFTDSNIVKCQSFIKFKNSIPVFMLPQYDIWAKFKLQNNSSENDLLISVDYPNLSYLSIYVLDTSTNKLSLINETGNSTSFFTRPVNDINFLFPVTIPLKQQKTYYIRFSNRQPTELPISVRDTAAQASNNIAVQLTIGIYLGIIICMLLYNLLLFFSTKDKNYLLYVGYLFFLGFAQITFAGWAFRYFWPNTPILNQYAIVFTSGCAGIFGVLFGKSFLNSSYYTPKLNYILNALILLYVVAVIMNLLGFSASSYIILNANSLPVGLVLLITSIIIIKKGYRPAIFYLFAWSFFLIGLIVFSLRNFGMIQTNNFTRFILYYTSAAEAIFLSIALADRINVLKKEKELSQAEALQQAQENEKLVNEQNIVLEQKVTQRTSELQSANTQLNETLINLKDTQTQLVEAEKMASLGQLTAGIAHEINNPINFVKSNITPLRLDVKDLMEVLNAYDELHNLNGDHNKYKQKLDAIEELKEDIDLPYVQKEINNLIAGIEEGAERTAEIVRGLRTFSRIDEAALKLVNVHDGILSTIVLLKNNIPYYVKVVKEFHSQGEIECFPGKLNQVFMNILTNAVQAITSKPNKTDQETLTIKTRDLDDGQIEISIKDTGMGMTEDVKHRIFEPFFTTKEVGEGTGLGMAIVFKIIQKHAGKINIVSAPGEGAEFIITLPSKYQGID